MTHAALTLLLAALLGGLGGRCHRGRAACHGALSRLGRLALPALEWGAGLPCPERSERCRRLLSRYAVEIADRESRSVLPTSYPRLPWITTVDLDWEFCAEDDWSYHWLALARRQGADGKGPEWRDYREATRLWVRSCLLQRRPAESIRRALDRMANEEIDWIRQHGGAYTPPLRVPEGH